MKRSTSAFRALASCCCVLAAIACVNVSAVGVWGASSARPRYGGTLRLELPNAIRQLAPSSTPADAGEAAARTAVLPLVFETLVRADGAAGLEPLLAESWRSDPEEKQWQFRLRSGVKLHDGTTLKPAQVAAVLREMDSQWTVTEIADGVRIESPQPLPGLPWDLADPRRAIAVSGDGAWPLGTGPFRIDRWDAGRRLMLVANNDCRTGRPFTDAVEIEMGRPVRDEVLDLEVGRADVVSVTPQDALRLSQRGLRVVSSQPTELLALVFDERRPAGGRDQTRRAIAFAVDDTAICNVLLQRQAEPATGLLPNWLSGYADLFTVRHDRAAAKASVASLPSTARSVWLEYPAADPTAQAIAERVAVDARDAGLMVTVAPTVRLPSHAPDVRLVRAGLVATTPERALAALLATLGVDDESVPAAGAPLASVYRFEQSLLDRTIVIPLVHLPRLYGFAPRLAAANGLLVRPSGALDLANAWVRPEKP